MAKKATTTTTKTKTTTTKTAKIPPLASVRDLTPAPFARTTAGVTDWLQETTGVDFHLGTSRQSEPDGKGGRIIMERDVSIGSYVPVDARLALQLARLDTQNRDKDGPHMRTLGEIMRAGNWIAGAKTIAISEEGIVVDGGQSLIAAALAQGSYHECLEASWLLALLDTINNERWLYSICDDAEKAAFPTPIDPWAEVTDSLLERVKWIDEGEQGLPAGTESMPIEEFLQTEVGEKLAKSRMPSGITLHSEELSEDALKSEVRQAWLPADIPGVNLHRDTPIEFTLSIGISRRWFGLADQVSRARGLISQCKESPKSYAALYDMTAGRGRQSEVTFEKLVKNAIKWFRPAKTEFIKVGTGKDAERVPVVSYGTLKGSGRTVAAATGARFVELLDPHFRKATDAIEASRKLYESARFANEQDQERAKALAPESQEKAVDWIDPYLRLLILVAAGDSKVPKAEMIELASVLSYGHTFERVEEEVIVPDGKGGEKTVKTKVVTARRNNAFLAVSDYLTTARTDRANNPYSTDDLIMAMSALAKCFCGLLELATYPVDRAELVEMLASEPNPDNAFRFAGLAMGYPDAWDKVVQGIDPSRGRGRAAGTKVVGGKVVKA